MLRRKTVSNSPITEVEEHRAREYVADPKNGYVMSWEHLSPAIQLRIVKRFRELDSQWKVG